ncbi:hypothetical protein KI387_025235, partial [Taxus chinensis]
MKDMRTTVRNRYPKKPFKFCVYRSVIKRVIFKRRRERNLNFLYASLRALLPTKSSYKLMQRTEHVSNCNDTDNESCSSSLMGDTISLQKKNSA